MKPARNAFIGYSYQKSVAFLMIAKMDVERKIKEIEIEADVNHQFDDLILVVLMNTTGYACGSKKLIAMSRKK
ncbi:hypothetical protein [Vallitalea guaymasensis]|uniref:Uncharacterized protein n=1 Tax=Vallitalea guaymasensis TaxID=1185412 RepID=A0A8J8MDX1_9FIRM|nr:hypothetical protein [Vallitalea guaymasensis]QUH31122.1 hypothetical protein HYG85_20235 [Vallitalea guaymasensis]